MSGLLHLVEAATALTKLGPSNLPPSTVYQAASSSHLTNTSVLSRRISTHTISDDDTSSSVACPKIATLRENHLQALRAAAVNAGLMATMTAPAAPVSVPAPTTSIQTSLASAYQAALAAPHPVAVSVSPPSFPVHQVTTTAATTTAIRIPRAQPDPAAISKEMFPMRLHALLADPNVRDVISWLPHGKSFVVLRPDVFATRVLPLYFAPEGSNSLNAKTSATATIVKNKSQGVHKYPSFTRKLNRWGFRQISRGPDAGAFCHELFQRDYPELSRGMVCQKSRKGSKKSMNGSGFQDDMMSVSSASTMGTKSIASCEKRPYSSTVTVSTAGNTSNKSLPFKKRKAGHHHQQHNNIANNCNHNSNINSNNCNYMVNDIPSMISHRNQKMMPASTSSLTESDMTSSDNGSVCSANTKTVAPAVVAPKVAPVAAAVTAQVGVGPEAVAREALARHFHEQHRAFALASLMENSRLAMQAVGIQNQVSILARVPVQQANQNQQQYPPVLGAITTHSPSVLAHTVSIPEEMKMPSTAANIPTATSAQSISSADAAKSALYKAYLQALSNNNSASS